LLLLLYLPGPHHLGLLPLLHFRLPPLVFHLQLLLAGLLALLFLQGLLLPLHF
jgi:hypothetical protein